MDAMGDTPEPEGDSPNPFSPPGSLFSESMSEVAVIQSEGVGWPIIVGRLALTWTVLTILVAFTLELGNRLSAWLPVVGIVAVGGLPVWLIVFCLTGLLGHIRTAICVGLAMIGNLFLIIGLWAGADLGAF